jgi:hypothetical protein
MIPAEPGTRGLRYLQPVADVLAPVIAGASNTLVPCTAEEIAALEALVAPHHLPAAYLEFLRYGGKQLAGVFSGVDFSYALARRTRENGNREILRMLRVVDKTAVLSETCFVINEHLAANFTYFELGEADDPPVYLWEDGNGGLDTAIREHDTFSSFVLAQAKNSVKFGRH